MEFFFFQIILLRVAKKCVESNVVCACNRKKDATMTG